MNTLVSKELIDFIRHECAIQLPEEIVADTGMQRELGVCGDDAVEFLVAYAKNFHVDVSHFMGADYFDGEGLYFLSLFKVKRTKKELTVGHLQRGIDARRLDEQVIHGA